MFVDELQLSSHGERVLRDGADVAQVGVVTARRQPRRRHVREADRLDLLDTVELLLAQQLRMGASAGRTRTVHE